MRSPWREPRRSAGRRARPASRCVAQATVSVARFRARGAGPWQHAPAPRGPNKLAPLGAPLPSLCAGGEPILCVLVDRARAQSVARTKSLCVIARSASGEAIQGGQGGSGCSLDCGAALANFGRERAARTLIICRLATRNGVALRTMHRQDGGGAGDGSASKGLAQEITIPTAGACWRARGFCKRSTPCRR